MKKLFGFAIRAVRSPVSPHRTGCHESSRISQGRPASRHRHPRPPRRRRRPEVHGRLQRDLCRRCQGLRPLQDRPQDHRIPTFVPQQPSDFQQPAPRPPRRRSAEASRRRRPSCPPTAAVAGCRIGPARPLQANYLAFGYTAAQNGVLVLQGWLYRSEQRYPGQRPAYRQDAIWRRWTKPARARSPMNSPPTLLLSSAASPLRHPYLFHLRPYRP